MKKLAPIVFLIVLIFQPPAYSWNALGHRVIAQISYDYLSPGARRYYAHLNQSLNTPMHSFNLITASTWLDLKYSQELLSLSPIHYIDIPFTVDGSPLPAAAEKNAIEALTRARLTLEQPESSRRKKAFALRVLLHVVGDLHQPMHTVSRVTVAHPLGDRGGNDFKLAKNDVAPNLHSYWDRAGGYARYPLSSPQIRKLASGLEHLWICPAEELDPVIWVKESNAIALNQAYTLQENTSPTALYQAQAQEISQVRWVYAGCRLAATLNRLWEKHHTKLANA